VQECLSNVAAHAEASRVHVELRRDGDTIRVAVEDDGRGPAPGFELEGLESRGHLGLTGMRERITGLGGELAISGGPGAGFRLDLSIPASGGTGA
jgi:signal transduction histidine kinase